ncbi:A24 family peptidase [Caldalkalibacillus mannanilyticus]|uniref:A24 family peptidase n=1 Tax=Caldalkalibacillus mannanilyticus TaxID=1418 RepID=UPI00046A4DB3|nr:prepilin peptidase [Caldalkalibacillus mannanilyticus]
MWFDVVLVTILVICVITDLKSRKIYNKVIFPGLLIALFSQVLLHGWAGLGTAMVGFMIGLGILLIPYLLGGMGAGDVKLLALIGALKGSHFVLETAFYMALIGALMAVVILLFHPQVIRRVKELVYFCYGMRHGIKLPMTSFRQGKLSATYPYGVAIAGGAIMSLFLEGMNVLW